MERTLRWSERASAKRRDDRALFGIVQGGVDPELRASLPPDGGARIRGVWHRRTVGGGVGGRPQWCARRRRSRTAVGASAVRDGARRHRGDPRCRGTGLRPLRLRAADSTGPARQGAAPPRRLLDQASRVGQRLEVRSIRTAGVSPAAGTAGATCVTCSTPRSCSASVCSRCTISATPST